MNGNSAKKPEQSITWKICARRRRVFLCPFLATRVMRLQPVEDRSAGFFTPFRFHIMELWVVKTHVMKPQGGGCYPIYKYRKR